MRRNHLLSLAAVTALVLGLGWWQAGERGQPGDAMADQPLFAGLDARLASLRALRVQGAAGEQVNIRVVDGAWQVEQLHGWPADPGRLRSAVLLLAQARVMERKTDRPGQYHRLGVQDPGSPGADSRLLELEFEDGALGLILGKAALGGSATYVRRAGEATALLVNQGLPLEADPLAWVNTRIPGLAARTVQRVEITHPDGETLTLLRPDAGSGFRLRAIPEGRVPAAGKEADAIAAALERLHFETVRPRQETDPASAVRVRYIGADGAAAEVLVKGREPAWARIRIEPGPGEDAGGIELEKWEFALPARQADLLTRRTEDLLVPAE